MKNNNFGILDSFQYKITNKNVPLETQPHYTNHRFDEAQVVFGEKINGLSWDYYDRLQQWDYEKSESAWKNSVDKNLVKRSANFYENYLSEYFGKKIEIVCIMAGVNRSNGDPYCVFGYRER